MDERESEGSRNQRPMPARVAMDGGEPEGEEPGGEIRTLVDPENGEEWVARVLGRSTSGVLPLRSIRLMEVAFFRAGELEAPQRHSIWQGTSLDDLDDEGLVGLLRGSKPFARPSPEATPREKKRRKDRPRRSP